MNHSIINLNGKIRADVVTIFISKSNVFPFSVQFEVLNRIENKWSHEMISVTLLLTINTVTDVFYWTMPRKLINLIQGTEE